MKLKGLLRAPYDGLAASIAEPKTFRAEPRPKGWARGGTVRREQGRAERKARRKAAIAKHPANQERKPAESSTGSRLIS